MLSPFGLEGGFSSCERTYPPRIIAVAAEARSFYVEFRARDEVGGFGHSYVTLGAINAVGEVRETVAAAELRALNSR